MAENVLSRKNPPSALPERLRKLTFSRLVSQFIKRSFDIIAAGIGLLCLSPVFVFVAILIKRDSPGPVFFWCRRMGRNGQPFQMLKFRTMYERLSSYQGPPVTCDGDDRITPIGQWLRDTKINELPQLWNVLKGEMSLVGPRPEDVGIAKDWPEDYKSEILSTRPGVTSPASIIYHDEEHLLSRANVMGEYLQNILPDKMRLDQLYVRNQTFSSDLDTIFWTLIIIVPRLAKRQIPVGNFFAGPISRFVHRHISWFLIDLMTSILIISAMGFVWRLEMPLNWGITHLAILSIVLAFLFSGVNAGFGLNRIVWSRATVDDGINLILSSSCVTLTIIVLDYLQSIYHWFRFPALPVIMVLTIGLLSQIGFVTMRFRWRVLTSAASRWLALRHNAQGAKEKVLIVGSGDGFQTACWLLRQGELRYVFSIVGVVDDNILTQTGMWVSGCLVMGNTREIPALIDKYDIGVILFTLPEIPQEIKDDLFTIAQRKNLRIALIHQMVKMLNQQLTLPVTIIDYPCGSDDYLKFLSVHDHITGLPNRFLFKDKLLSTLAYSRRYKTRSAVMFIHIDRLDDFCNYYDRIVRDELLRNLTARLLGCKRESDTLAYLNCGEFGLILRNVGEDGAIPIIAKRIRSSISEPIKIGGKEIILEPKISVCGDIDDCVNPTKLTNEDVEVYLTQRVPVLVSELDHNG